MTLYVLPLCFFLHAFASYKTSEDSDLGFDPASEGLEGLLFEEDPSGLNLLQATASVVPVPVAHISTQALENRDVRSGWHPPLNELEDILRPIFVSLPKNIEGTVDPAGIRYTLSRYFAHQHGWRIKNLEPEGIECDADSQTGPFLEIAKEIDERGRSLREIAQIAEKIEVLIHMEALERLRLAYRLEGLVESSALSDVQVEAVMDVYMAAYVLGGNVTAQSHHEIITDVKKIFTEDYWGRAQQFIRSVRSNFTKSENEQWTFEDVERLAFELGDRFGPFRAEEYIALKHKLMSLESENAQCVPLSKFYGSGMWQFGESADYLRFLGALESSNPRNPHVIIPNYLNAHSNCLTVSSFYSVCFVNECDDLLSHVENKISAQDASVKQLALLVGEMSSSTVSAPRALPAGLLRHLYEISSLHLGRVPLHSRLFAQWMHFAFPRECPYPYMSGETTTLTVDRYENVTGKSPVATREEMQGYLVAMGFLKKKDAVPNAEGTCMPWTTDEEQVVDGITTNPLNSMDIRDGFGAILIFIGGIAFASLLLWIGIFLGGIGSMLWKLAPTPPLKSVSADGHEKIGDEYASPMLDRLWFQP